MSWDALGGNPVPGSPIVTLSMAMSKQAMSVESEQLFNRLRRLEDGAGRDVWRGEAADTFHRLIAEVGPDLGRMTDAYHHAYSALKKFSDAMFKAQELARQAEADADRAITDRNRAAKERARAAEAAERHERLVRECQLKLIQAARLEATAIATNDMAWLAQLQQYAQHVRETMCQAETSAALERSREKAAQAEQSAAEARLQVARSLADQARATRDTAARTAVSLLDAEQPATSRPVVIEWIGDILGAGFSVWNKVTNLTWLLDQNKLRSGRYTDHWRRVMRYFDSLGVNPERLRYKRSKTFWAAHKIEENRMYKRLAHNPVLRRIGIVVTIGEIIHDGKDAYSQFRRGDWLGGTSSSMDGAGAAFRQIGSRGSVPIYLTGVALSVYSDVITEARKVDWKNLPSAEDWRKYGWESAAESLVKVGKMGQDWF